MVSFPHDEIWRSQSGLFEKRSRKDSEKLEHFRDWTSTRNYYLLVRTPRISLTLFRHHSRCALLAFVS